MPITRVLILSTNPAFAREVSSHWPSEPENLPEFTVLDQALVHDLDAGQYDLAIADVSSPDSHSVVKKALAATGKPALLIHADNSLPFSSAQNGFIELRGQDGLWPVVAGLIGREILGRCLAETRAYNAEKICAIAQAEATLGRYMVEMRHNVNNALTSVLGNAELLSMEPGLPAKTRVQADTILNMALRLHEVFQRFASLEKELSVAAREAGKTPPQPRATAAGS